MNEFIREIELNPLRVLSSLSDHFQNELRLANIRINFITMDIWCLVLSAASLFFTYNEDKSDPMVLGFFIVGCLLVPYDLQYLISVIKNPIPYFRQEGDWTIRDGDHFSVWCFGAFDKQYETKTFVGMKDTIKTKKLKFRWCRGTLKVKNGEMAVNVSLKSYFGAFGAGGVVKGEIQFTLPRFEAQMGVATNHFFRSSAVRLQSEQLNLTAIIRKRAQ